MMRISIVTITYQAATVLPRTLASVLEQDYPNVEHLIVDGASKDNTVTLAENYRQQIAAAHPAWLVNIQSEPDKGLYDAMNKGLRKCTGDYVVFLNAGDCFPSAETLQTVAKAVEDSGLHPAVVYGDTDVVDDEGRFLSHRQLSPPEHLSWRSFRQGMLVCHQAFYARTDVAKLVPYDLQYRYSADVDWCIRVMKVAEEQGLPLVNTHSVLVNYLQEGLSTIHHRASLKERFKVMRSHYGLFSTLCFHAWFIFRALARKIRF